MQRSMVPKRKSNLNWRPSLSGTMTGAPPSPPLFFETANAFHRTEALQTALELQLFTAITGRRGSQVESAEPGSRPRTLRGDSGAPQSKCRSLGCGLG